MNTYVLLIEYDYSGRFGGARVLGTFDSVQNANYFAKCRFNYKDFPNFDNTRENLRQVRYITDKDNNQCRLTLSPTTQNPYDNLGALKLAFKDEPSINKILTNKDYQKSFVEHAMESHAVYPYYLKDKVSLQLWGWAINLFEDGTWFWEDTSGG